MKVENKVYMTLRQLIYITSFLLPNIAFLIIPSPYAFNDDLSFIDKTIIFSIYMIPTILFLFCIKEIKIRKKNIIKRKFNINIVKEEFLIIILILYSIIIGIYLSKNQFFYISVPIILIAIELIFIKIFNFFYLYDDLYYLWKYKKVKRLSENELKSYNKWEGFSTSLITIILYFIFILIPVSAPLIYFNILNFNLITVVTFIIVCSIFFISQEPFQQILDCKFNSFIKCQGVCVNYGQSGKGVGGYHTIKILEGYNKEITFSSKSCIFRTGEKVMIIIGVHSNKVIGFYKIV